MDHVNYSQVDIVVDNLKQISLQWILNSETSASEENDESVVCWYQKPFLLWQVINLDLLPFGLSKYPRKEMQKIIVRMIAITQL